MVCYLDQTVAYAMLFVVVPLETLRSEVQQELTAAKVELDYIRQVVNGTVEKVHNAVMKVDMIQFVLEEEANKIIEEIDIIVDATEAIYDTAEENVLAST